MHLTWKLLHYLLSSGFHSCSVVLSMDMFFSCECLLCKQNIVEVNFQWNNIWLYVHVPNNYNYRPWNDLSVFNFFLILRVFHGSPSISSIEVTEIFKNQIKSNRKMNDNRLMETICNVCF